MKKVVSRVLSTVMIAALMTTGISVADTEYVQMPLVSTVYAASQIGITQATGWMESAWVEWSPSSTSGVSYYKVSYSSGGSYTQIDDELVRLYKDGHWRADIVGIAAGNYTIKVEACNSSGSAVATETASVTVTSHDRTGFTFSPSSTYYDSSDPLQCGGYKGNGTPKDNAEILYITSASDVDSVTDSTGTTGLSKIMLGRDKRTTRPLIVRIVGKIDYSGSQLNSAGYIQVKPSTAYTEYKTTIEGIGSDATTNFGFLVRNGGNIEIRNLAIHDFGDDGLSLDTSNCNVWLHNNEFFYGVQGSGDKAKGDGSSDVKNDSQYVTLSYNHYWDGGKVSLCGMTSETGENWISYHHNWFDHSDSRHPRIRTMFVHVYNNYYDGNAKYGVGCSKNSNAFVEGNYFRNCKYPVLQGGVGHDSDGKGGSNTFDDSPGIGAAKLWNNYMTGSNLQFTAGASGDTSSDADGCVATSRNQKVTYTTSAGATYSNADVNDSYIQSLASKIQEPADAKATVEKYAGRIGGGDFASATGFAFTSSDDTDYSINSKLRTALTNYSNDSSINSNYVISQVGGSVDGSFVPEATTETTTSAPTGGDTPVETTTSSSSSGTSGSYTGDSVWNYTNGTNTLGASVTANEWSGATAVTYKGASLTKAVKMESSTSISFTAPSDGTITVVTYSTKDGPTIKVNGTAYDVSSEGDTMIEVSAGTVTIAKGSASTYLYLVEYSGSGTTTKETTTETTTTTTTKVTTTTTESTTESTTQAPSSGELSALSAGSYDYNTILSDTSKFVVTGSSSTTQVKINESGNVQFKVNDNANVTINFKCGSTTTSKTAAVTLNGQTSSYVAGGASATDFTVNGLSAGTYTIGAKQTDGTTAQIMSVTVSYGTASTVVKGDADGDNDVDMTDVNTVLNYVTGKISSVQSSADVDGDNKITIADAYKIYQKVLGIISSL